MDFAELCLECRAMRPQEGDLCLSIRQPFAWFVCEGWKHIENRSRPTAYRGPLWIHAGQRLAVGFRSWRDLLTDLPSGADPAGPVEVDGLGTVPAVASLARGCIVDRVVLADCRPLARLATADRQSIWAEGPFCWLLEAPVALAEPLPCRGQVGLWRWRDRA
jgi:hypothetical protein